MALIPPTSLICTGVLLSVQLELIPAPTPLFSHVVTVASVVLPSPSWPNWLEPQAHTVPSLFSAKLYLRPLATASTLPRLLTRTGVLLLVISSSPSWPLILCSWPLVLEPQAQTVPSFFRARL